MTTHRFIDPAIRKSESVAHLTFRQRDLWYGLILTVDDQGRGLANPALIRSQVWPLEDISLDEIKLDLQQLEAEGFIQEYEIDGKKYLQIVKWQVYQRKAEWLSASKYPAPSGWTDRFRYHGKGRQVIQSDNWNSSRLPNELEVFSSPLPKELNVFSGRLPNDDVNGNGNEDVNGDCNDDVDVDCGSRVESSLKPLTRKNPVSEPLSLDAPILKISRPDQLKIWNEAMGQVQREMSKADFDAWMRDLKMVGMNGSNNFKVMAINTYARDWVQSRAGPMLLQKLRGLSGQNVGLVVLAENDVDVSAETQ